MIRAPSVAQVAEQLVLGILRRMAETRRRTGDLPPSSNDPRPDFRAVFISDVHIGLVASQVEELCRFLERHRASELYLVGDIVDLCALERRPRVEPTAGRLVRLLYRLTRQGTRVVLIPGNHDAALRAYIGREPGIELYREIIYRDARGRRLLVTHGDEVDRVVNCHPSLSRTGSLLYDWALGLSRAVNIVRRALDLPYWNVAGALKLMVKRVCTYVSNWEETLISRIRFDGLDGVICGHIHVPRIGELCNVPYLNCGDWVEHATALAETWEGTFLLLSPHDGARLSHRAGTPWAAQVGETLRDTVLSPALS